MTLNKFSKKDSLTFRISVLIWDWRFLKVGLSFRALGTLLSFSGLGKACFRSRGIELSWTPNLANTCLTSRGFYSSRARIKRVLSCGTLHWQLSTKGW